MNTELIGISVGVIFAAGIFVAATRYTKRDVNGIGRKQRRMILVMILQCRDMDEVHQVARMLLD